MFPLLLGLLLPVAVAVLVVAFVAFPHRGLDVPGASRASLAAARAAARIGLDDDGADWVARRSA